MGGVDRFVPALDLYAPWPHARAAHRPMALTSGPLRSPGGLERLRGRPCRVLAAPGTPVPRALLLHRVRDRAARRAAVVAEVSARSARRAGRLSGRIGIRRHAQASRIV